MDARLEDSGLFERNEADAELPGSVAGFHLNEEDE